jgi:hypothetical protein
MKRITFKQLNNKWRLTIGSGSRERKEPITLYAFLEQKIDGFLASTEQGKTCVRVVYATGNHNESVASKNKVHLLYALGCFLEEYLSDEKMVKIERKYL